eukprot:9294571-Pyramimonas_sp.AAC.1
MTRQGLPRSSSTVYSSAPSAAHSQPPTPAGQSDAATRADDVSDDVAGDVATAATRRRSRTWREKRSSPAVSSAKAAKRWHFDTAAARSRAYLRVTIKAEVTKKDPHISP